MLNVTLKWVKQICLSHIYLSCTRGECLLWVYLHFRSLKWKETRQNILGAYCTKNIVKVEISNFLPGYWILKKENFCKFFEKKIFILRSLCPICLLFGIGLIKIQGWEFSHRFFVWIARFFSQRAIHLWKRANRSW